MSDEINARFSTVGDLLDALKIGDLHKDDLLFSMSSGRIAIYKLPGENEEITDGNVLLWGVDDQDFIWQLVDYFGIETIC